MYATALAAVLSVLDPRHRLTPRRAIAALDAGVRGALPVVAICAAAGVLTAVTTKTGLGPQAASLIVSGARALTTDPALVAALTAVLAAAALCLLGLAVPVTASFIIGWVIIGPALLDLGVGPAAAALFVFYFAVLSETTPPTALAAAAAAAVTGARVLPTMWQTLRYALPAYLVPMAFVLTPTGAGLLGMGGAATVVYAGVTTALSVAVLSVAAGGWLLGVGPAGRPERTLAGCAGIVLLWLTPTVTLLGVALSATVVVAVLIRRRTARPAPAEQSPLR